MIARNSPASTTRSIPRNAWTSTSPMTKVRVTFSTRRTGSIMSYPQMFLSKARRRRGPAICRPAALFAHDDGVAGSQVAAEDLCESFVVETGRHVRRDRPSVAQDPHPRLRLPLAFSLDLGGRVAQGPVGDAQDVAPTVDDDARFRRHARHQR